MRLDRRRVRRLLGGAVGLAVIGVTFAVVLPRIADYHAVWKATHDLSRWGVVALAATTVANIVTFAPPWQVALPGLGLRQALVVTQASTASTYVAPGGAAPGLAVSFAMLRGWGFRTSEVARAVALTGVWNQLVILGFPPAALALLTVTGGHSAVLQTVAVIGFAVFVAFVGIFAAGLSSARLARRVGNTAARIASGALRLIRRGPVHWGGESLASFRREALHLLRRRWHVLTLATLAGHLTVFGVLLASLRSFGVTGGEVSLVEAFAGWSIARLLGSLPITPGGIGLVEVGLTGALVGFGGANAEVVAAVLVYRFLTIVPTLCLGALAGATWRRHNPHLVREQPDP
jgi:uncharacterized membrane protein YbhN (UPF0104 family)